VWSLIASRVYRQGYRAPVRTIRALDHARDADACDAIVAGLRQWFGDEKGIRDCAAAVRSHEGLVAVDDDEIVGFLTWEPRADRGAEITWMAVRAGDRRAGVGRSLLDALTDSLRADGVGRLDVKTLSSRDPYPPYAETRAFYRANGFREIEELDIWGPENPAVLLRRSL
jgi:ribosomal protein S18 acetylase RimI-like enzyme